MTVRGLRVVCAAAILIAAATVAALTHACAAPQPNALDLPPSGVVTPQVDMLNTAPAQAVPAPPREPSGNPLWAIPLSALSATRDRPLFTPSRRPPAPPAVAVAPRVEPVAPPPPPPAEPERPLLTLVGAIAGDNGGIAIFLDQTTNDVVRLKTGDRHSGWLLQTVKGREATFSNDREAVTLALPAPGEATAAPPVGIPRIPGMQMPPAVSSPFGLTAPPGRAPPGRQKEPEL